MGLGIAQFTLRIASLLFRKRNDTYSTPCFSWSIFLDGMLVPF
jgi:hypothetical protein